LERPRDQDAEGRKKELKEGMLDPILRGGERAGALDG